MSKTKKFWCVRLKIVYQVYHSKQESKKIETRLIDEIFASVMGENKRGKKECCNTKNVSRDVLHRPGIEPGSLPWQGSILPLDQRCTHSEVNVVQWLLAGTRGYYRTQKILCNNSGNRRQHGGTLCSRFSGCGQTLAATVAIEDACTKWILCVF